MMSSFLAERRLEPEEMDNLALPDDELQAALMGLARLNWASQSNSIGWPPVKLVANFFAPRSVRVLDIATGSGDVPIAMAGWGKRKGLNLDIWAIDINAKSIEFARHKARAAKAEVTFECLDAINDELPGDFDVVMCSLFLHHLPKEQAITLLRKMAAAAKVLGIVIDLRRSIYGYALAYVASRLLSRSRIVHRDAVRSVRAAFTLQELHQISEEAGVPSGRSGRQWPARMSLVWYTPNWAAGLSK